MDIVVPNQNGKTKCQRVRKNKRILGLSIELRPAEVETREELGHWEIDTVEGRRKDQKMLLTLTERKTRNEIIRIIDGKKPEDVNKAIDEIRESFGEMFSKCFKSITADNGSEFSLLSNIFPQNVGGTGQMIEIFFF